MADADAPLLGKKVAVLVESEFIPAEIRTYQTRFSELGATLELVSRLWGQPSQTFLSDVTERGGVPETLEVAVDFKDRAVEDYDAIVMAANYTSVRLRYFEPPPGTPIGPDQVASAPAVQFFADAMKHPGIVKGALCHGLWILTPVPALLRGRRVVCHEVVLADILNAGAVYVPPDEQNRGVVVDDDLVTGRSGQDAPHFAEIVAQTVLKRAAGRTS